MGIISLVTIRVEAQRLYSVEMFRADDVKDLQNPIERYLANLPEGCLIEGSFFDPDEFYPGSIVFKGGKTVKEEYVRFNWLRDQLEVLSGQDTSVFKNPEVIDFIESNIGKPVRILYTSYKGTIHRCNKSEGGFYPGIQYPVYVKITESSDPRYDHAVGSVFEYGLDQIELI